MMAENPIISGYAKRASAVAGLPAAEPDVAESVSSFGELIYNVEVTVEYVVQVK